MCEKEQGLANTEGQPRRPRLGSLRGVRTEMARLYEAALNGRMEASKASRMVYILKEIRCAIESETLERLEQRLAELGSTAGINNGRTKHDQSPRPWH
jgi:hypothetical protein